MGSNLNNPCNRWWLKKAPSYYLLPNSIVSIFSDWNVFTWPISMVNCASAAFGTYDPVSASRRWERDQLPTLSNYENKSRNLNRRNIFKRILLSLLEFRWDGLGFCTPNKILLLGYAIRCLAFTVCSVNLCLKNRIAFRVKKKKNKQKQVHTHFDPSLITLIFQT